jgi:hypothetical protein
MGGTLHALSPISSAASIAGRSASWRLIWVNPQPTWRPLSIHLVSCLRSRTPSTPASRSSSTVRRYGVAPRSGANLWPASAPLKCPFGGRARLAGWSLLELYGLHPAPRARLSATGVGFLATLRAHQIVEIDHRAITMVARTSARLRVYRGEVDPDVVLAWEICRSPTASIGT